MAILFIATGLMTGVLGVSDIKGARDLSHLMFGLVWLAAALTAGFAAYAVIKAKRWWAIPSLVAGLSGSLMAVYILWLDNRSVTHEPYRPIVWFYLALSVAACAVVAIITRLTPVKSWPVVIAVFVPFLGIIQLWYTTQYVPATELPQVNISSSLKETMSERGVTVLQGNFSLVNSSKARIQVLGSIYQIRATPIAQVRVPDEAESYQVATAFEWFENERRFARGKRYKPDELIQADEILPIHATFEPGQKWSTNFVAEVDARKYWRATFVTNLMVLRLNRLELDEPQNCGQLGAHRPQLITVNSKYPNARMHGRYVCLERSIKPRNTVERLVGDSPVFRNYLALSWTKDHNAELVPPYPLLRVGLRGLDSQGLIGPVQDRLQRAYPVVFVFSHAETALKPAKDFTG